MALARADGYGRSPPPLLALLDADPSALAGFDRVSVHAPAKTDEAPGGRRRPPRAAAVRRRSPSRRLRAGADMRAARAAGGLREHGRHQAVRTRQSKISRRSTAVPEAGFCFDVAHAWTNDRTSARPRVAGRVRRAASSAPRFGDRGGRHASADDTRGPRALRRLLDRCRHVPWLLESEVVGADP